MIFKMESLNIKMSLKVLIENLLDSKPNSLFYTIVKITWRRDTSVRVTITVSVTIVVTLNPTVTMTVTEP